eukprot:SAG22_NODE_1853_length_3438_cov_3.020066_3_plen_270_part_00
MCGAACAEQIWVSSSFLRFAVFAKISLALQARQPCSVPVWCMLLVVCTRAKPRRDDAALRRRRCRRRLPGSHCRGGGRTPQAAAFEVLWNSPWPTECASNPPPRGGDDPSKPVSHEPEWRSFDIKTNAGSAYNGAVVATLYPHDTGLYPYIDGSCGPEGPATDYNCTVGVAGKPRTAVNGGIPQLLNLSAHLEKWEADIERLLPDPEWAGVANLDWESWSPVWEENSYDEYRIYLNRSIELVLEQHPSFTLPEAVPVAKAQFEASAREL